LHFRLRAVAFEITTTETPRCAGPCGIFAIASTTAASAFLATRVGAYILHLRMRAIAKALETTTSEAPWRAGPCGIFALTAATVAITFVTCLWALLPYYCSECGMGAVTLQLFATQTPRSTAALDIFASAIAATPEKALANSITVDEGADIQQADFERGGAHTGALYHGALRTESAKEECYARNPIAPMGMALII
jgi:hypothetical protein